MIKAILTSSVEKLFLDEVVESYQPLTKISALQGERISFQLGVQYVREDENEKRIWGALRIEPKIECALKEYMSIRFVESVPVAKPTHDGGSDDNYLRKKPGLFPDVLSPMQYGGRISVANDILRAYWIQFDLPKEVRAGEYEFVIRLEENGFEPVERRLTIEIIDAVLPDEDIHLTQWFHCDCLAQYYNVPVWSERHWEIVENFVRVAVRNGINLLLTPIFTPPLDTAVGGERLTNQLITVTVNKGEYSFDFALFDRWVEMCNRCGVKNFEISHLFTQWGASAAPKIMATVDGEYKRIFGWETKATGEEYKAFLKSFLTEFVSHIKELGIFERCFWHVSDEPSLNHLENYKSAKKVLTDIIGDCYIMDALSKIDFYKTGALDHPIPSSNHIEPFLESKIEGLWTYYCVSQYEGVSNRFHAMPAWRNRCIGMQMFKYDIVGFLQWGYNFYNSQFSTDPINPYTDCASSDAFVAGDPFSVYPAQDGGCIESSRIVVFHEALQDLKAMKLCAELYGKETVVCEMEKLLGYEIKFNRCVTCAEEMLSLRAMINDMIKAKVKK